MATIAADVTDLRTAEAELARMLAREQESRLQLEIARRELAELNEQLHILASTDPLTGLANRMNLLEHVSSMLARAERNGAAVASVYVDLDRFKLVNDRFGHHVGDEMLRSVAERLRLAARRGDVIARLGGDEFVVLLTDVERDRVERVVESLVARVCAGLAEPFVFGGVEIRVSSSVGTSIYPLDAADARALLERADGAMYDRKRARPERTIAVAPASSAA